MPEDASQASNLQSPCTKSLTPLFLPAATEELSLAPAAPQGLSPPRLEQHQQRHTEPGLRTKHICALQAAFPCCSSHSKAPPCRMWSFHKEWSYATGLQQLFCLPCWGMNFPALQEAQLCSSAVPALSLTSLPTTCLKQCSEQEKERNQSAQNYPRARHFHLKYTHSTTDPLSKQRGKQPGQMWSRRDGSSVSCPGLLFSGGENLSRGGENYHAYAAPPCPRLMEGSPCMEEDQAHSFRLLTTDPNQRLDPPSYDKHAKSWFFS